MPLKSILTRFILLAIFYTLKQLNAIQAKFAPFTAILYAHIICTRERERANQDERIGSSHQRARARVKKSGKLIKSRKVAKVASFSKSGKLIVARKLIKSRVKVAQDIPIYSRKQSRQYLYSTHLSKSDYL